MSQRYVCDSCGYEGRADADGTPDEIQCPMCGEPVTPLDDPSRPAKSGGGARPAGLVLRGSCRRV